MPEQKESADEARRDYAPYNPAEVEDRWYAFWERQGFFKPSDDPQKPTFTIIMPPPNVTGALHMGHALTASIEDALTRWHRMRGDATLWLPGRDHAGIAGQWVVERQLAQQGITRHDLGRERFLDHVWDWMHTYGQVIRDQHKRLGVSADWDRERFTMDPGPTRAVRTAFVRLYDKGLIYRGNRITNWCPRCRSALSDLEVEHEVEAGQLTHVRYPVVGDESQAVVIATTRPETILADTAVAVNPEDPRYRDLIGKQVRVPIVDRAVPVIADEAVDPSFGTGALKITPGHDPVDFEVGQRHNLDTQLVIGLDGRMNGQAGAFAGQPVLEARANVVRELESRGLLVKTEPYSHSVGHCQRCGTVVEPLVSEQWYVRIKPLADPALEAVRDGRIEIIPERFARVYYNWMENIRDWCISRQLWWGHRIPVWYCRDCGEQFAAVEDPTRCRRCQSERIDQDPDVLDTWFSSALWPFSTLGWPDETEDFKRFYPTSVLETGYDILFFWVARMIMMGLELAGDIPFRHVYLHGLIRVLSPEGKRVKMSKTAGNVQDPLDLIERFGTDAVRLALVSGASPGNDFTLSLDKIEAQRDFVNKLWNVGRFVMANTSPESRAAALQGLASAEGLSLADRWIVSRANTLVREVNRNLDEFQLGEAARSLYDFLWAEFADWYLEVAKIELRDAPDDATRQRLESILASVLETALRLLHPFAPFATEELWQRLLGEVPANERAPALMVADWPAPRADRSDHEAEDRMEDVMELVRGFRRLRADYRIEPGRRVPATIVADGQSDALRALAPAIAGLARLEPLSVEERLERRPARALSLVVGGLQAFVPIEGLFDLEAEIDRLGGELKQVQQTLERLEGLLSRPGFVEKAPPDVVAKEREKLDEQHARRRALAEQLDTLAAFASEQGG